MGGIGFDRVVGFVLAILFALVMGLSMEAVLISDFLKSQELLSPGLDHTLRIAGFAGALAALVAWWAQTLAASRNVVIRFIFALVIFLMAFCSFGGLLRMIYVHMTYPSQQDWSLSGLYFSSIDDFYTFVLSLLGPSLPAYVALVAAAGLYIGLFGPRETAPRR